MDQLPVTDALPALNAALDKTGAAVLVAPPGAGKTTLVPLALLQAKWLGSGKIIMLEPRRLAARTAARRMASTLGEAVGQTIGYRMRLETKVSAQTKIEVVTEGVFQRMICDDPSLDGIACVIFDEFHERSLDADFGLALTLDMRAALRDDLRLLIMSATLDGDRLAALIGNAPVVESKGRMFPVETIYQPRRADQRIEEAMASAIRKALIEHEGSILAFLPGQAEIRRTAQSLEDRLPANAYVAPLFGAMDIRDQDLAVQKPEDGKRKIVLATSLAETSITIDGVRIIIDSGLARLPNYEAALGISRLETKRASKASITQRAGRAGRTAPGVAIRLWQEEQTAALPDFEEPEIVQADLASMLLNCLAWGVGDPAELTFLDAPPKPHLDEARRQLESLGATDAKGGLTTKGKALAQIGLEPRLASMIYEGVNVEDRRRRAFLALLLGERGAGGNSTDLAQRFERFWMDKSPRAKALRQMAERIASSFPKHTDGNAQSDVSEMLCDAFPDRIAKARADQPGHFIMVNGRGARVDETDPLARQPYVIIADLIGSASHARAVSLAAIEEKQILVRFDDQIEDAIAYRFDKQTGKLSSRKIRRLGGLNFSQATIKTQPSDAVTNALIKAIRQYGLQALPWSKDSSGLRERLAWLRAALGTPWPQMDDEALLASLEGWLAPFLAGQTDLASLAGGGLKEALLSTVPFDIRHDIERLAPTHFTVPTGSNIALQYRQEGLAPVLSARVQELFGLASHPSIGGGKVPLAVELLSPAQRPIQLTMDLPGFWTGSWRDVRADMRGRYPRHEWPEDPANAAPTRRAKPRK